MSILIFVVSFIVYFATVSNTLLGGDAGDLVSAILAKGFPHPPGYPLYTLLGIVFNSLPLPLTIAGRVTLISTLATAASCALIYLILREITQKDFRKGVAILATSVTAASFVVWLYAVVPEVFALNTFIALSLFFSALRYHKTASLRYLCLMMFFVGLGISHHHTFILILPSVLYLMLKKKSVTVFLKRDYYKPFLSLLLGLLPISYLYFAYKSGSDFIWGHPDSIGGMMFLLLRKYYGSLIASPLVLTIPQSRFAQVTHLFYFFLDDFTVIGSILMLFGLLFYVVNKDKSLRVYLNAIYLSLFLLGPFFLFYANFPLFSNYYLGTVERYLHIFYFFCTLLLYFGIVFFTDHILSPLLAITTKNKVLVKKGLAVATLILFLYPVILFYKNFRIIWSLKNDRTAERLGEEVLANTKKDSIIIVGSDTLAFDTQYIYYSNAKYRNSSTLIHENKLFPPFYGEPVKRLNPKIVLPARNSKNTIADFLRLNKSRHPIFAESRYTLVGLDGYTWVSRGILFELVKSSEDDEQKDIEILNKFWATSQNKELLKKRSEPKYSIPFTSEILHVYAQAHLETATYLFLKGHNKEAYPHIQQASVFSLDDEILSAKVLFFKAIYMRREKNCQEAERLTIEAYRKIPESVYFNHLRKVRDECYTGKEDKDRLTKKARELLKSRLRSLDKF